jgi:hypothetical protein
MGQRHSMLADRHIRFIARQRIYFVATAAAEGRVNLSPKGMDTLKVLGPSRVVWLNLTGSGNETAAQVQLDPRMTLMFCAFEGEPLILRLYGRARAVHRTDPDWPGLSGLFAPLPGARQVFDLTLDLVQSSCGMGVPLLDYRGERSALLDWAQQKGEEGLRRYWAQKNAIGIDGVPTGIVDKNG